MLKRYFIIGTDTECGKTYATGQLVDYFKQNKAQVQAIKPVASGCRRVGNEWVSEDEEQLNQHNADIPKLIKSWRLEPPISPHLAAEQSGQLITIDDLMLTCFDSQFDALDYLLIEGAGGLMVPLNERETWIDFLVTSKLPVILVVGMRLGCLNHALLTEHALRSYNIPCAGWIANCIDPEMLVLSENIETLSKKISAPFLATIPHNGSLDFIGDNGLSKPKARCYHLTQ